MATNRNKFDEVAEEAQAANENKEFPQQAQATNENNEGPQQAQVTNENNVGPQQVQATNENNEGPQQAQATNENIEGPQQAQATNENIEGPQQAQATNENNAVAVTQDACQGGGMRAWVSGKLRQLWSRPVSQCSYMDADPNITSYKVIYRSFIERSTKTPYTFKFHDPAHIITGIACVPKDAETSSPEVEVVRGGVGFKEVEIVLTPVQKGNWCCRVLINGIEDNRLEMGSSSYKELSM